MKANFPGGGVESRCPVECLLREFGEELPGFKIKKKWLSKARVLHEAQVPTSKGGWKGKYLILVVVQVPSLKHVVADGMELGMAYLEPNKQRAIRRVKKLRRTNRIAREAYLTALRKL